MKKAPIKHTIAKWMLIVMVGVSGLFIIKNNIKSDDYKINLDNYDQNPNQFLENQDEIEYEKIEDYDGENEKDLQTEQKQSKNVKSSKKWLKIVADSKKRLAMFTKA